MAGSKVANHVRIGSEQQQQNHLDMAFVPPPLFFAKIASHYGKRRVEMIQQQGNTYQRFMDSSLLATVVQYSSTP